MPQAATRRATISIGKTRMVIGLPFSLCSLGGSALCEKQHLVQRLCGGESSPLKVIEESFTEFVDDLDDYVDKTRLGNFSIELPFVHFMPAQKRVDLAMKLKQLLHEADMEADVFSLETLSLEAAAAR